MEFVNLSSNLGPVSSLVSPFFSLFPGGGGLHPTAKLAQKQHDESSSHFVQFIHRDGNRARKRRASRQWTHSETRPGAMYTGRLVEEQQLVSSAEVTVNAEADAGWI